MKYDKTKFKFSKDKGVWHNSNHGTLTCPTVLIKGDRMVHASFDGDSYGFIWDGSTINDWHGRVDMTFDEAYLWVLDGKGDDAFFKDNT